MRNPNEKDSRHSSHADPTRPMGSWKSAWYALRREAARKFPKLATIRMYDLRHTAATMLAENPNASEGTLKDIMGHGPYSRLALDHYSHVRIGPKRNAIDSLSGLRPDSSPHPPRREIVITRLSSLQMEDPLDILRMTQPKAG